MELDPTRIREALAAMGSMSRAWPTDARGAGAAGCNVIVFGSGG